MNVLIINLCEDETGSNSQPLLPLPVPSDKSTSPVTTMPSLRDRELTELW